MSFIQIAFQSFAGIVFLCLLSAVPSAFAIADCKPVPAGRSDAFIVVKGAKQLTYLQCVYVNGWKPFVLGYSVKEDYPATAAIKAISEALIQKGWKMSKKNFVSDCPSSKMGTWVRQPTQITGYEGKLLSYWCAVWENNAGEVVQYNLSYSIPFSPDEPIPEVDLNSSLRVGATYVPADQVNLIIGPQTISK